MRYFKIIALHFQDALQTRTRSFVWFLVALVGPLTLILFWNGAQSKSGTIGGWTRSELNAYYLLMIIAFSGLISHIEEKIADDDIREGGLVKYITRPFSYFWLCFFEEIPYRIMQATFGTIAFFILSHLIVTISIPQISLATIIIFAGAYFLCFILQSTIALIAFWVINTQGFFNTLEVVRTILTGILMPIVLLPSWLATLSYISPFPYIIYFPVITILGKTSSQLQIWIMFMQILWICIFACLYFILWKFGLRKFSGVGQ